MIFLDKIAKRAGVRIFKKINSIDKATNDVLERTIKVHYKGKEKSRCKRRKIKEKIWWRSYSAYQKFIVVRKKKKGQKYKGLVARNWVKDETIYSI